MRSGRPNLLGAASIAALCWLSAGTATAQQTNGRPTTDVTAGTDQQTAPPKGGTNVTATAPIAQDPAEPAQKDIIVTALRRSESVLKVPATIAVIGGGDLKTVGVNTVSDLQNLIPGVNIGSGNFGANIAIRGVTSTDQTSKGELGIAFNIDGAFIGRGQEEQVAFFDLERVEVLKGPQGTLYGRSSTGGAINVITKKPTLDRVGGYAKLELSSYDTKRFEAAINLPLSSTLALRVAGNINDTDGYLHPTATTVIGSPAANNGAGPSSAVLGAGSLPARNDQVDQTGRASLLFKPSDRLTATVVATVGHIGGTGSGTATQDDLLAGGYRQFQVVPNLVPTHLDEHFYNFNEQVNLKFGGAQLDLLGNEQHFTARDQSTGTYNPFDTGNPTAGPQFMLDNYRGTFETNQAEARVSNIDTGFLDYVVGANYYHEKINESDHNWNAPLTSSGGLSPTSQWTNAIDPVNTTQHEAYGFFGQVTLHLFARLGVVGGIRYTHDQSTRLGTFSVGPVAGCTYPNDCIGGPNNGAESDSKITWRGGLNFQMTPNDLFYASVSTGFKAGGFNDFDPRTGTTAPYGPEQLTAYEIGYKGRPLSRLTLSLSGYYYDYSKDQINGLTLFPTPNGVVGVLFTQLAPVEIYGAEGELRYQIYNATQFTAALAYEHSRIISLQTGFLGYLTGKFADFSGYALPSTPKFVANLSLTHAFQLAGDAQLRFRAATKISDGYYLNDYANAVRFRQPAFTRSDFSLTYAAAADRYTVQLFVENIENQLQRTAGPGGYNGTYGGFTGGMPTPEADGTAYPTQSLNFGVSRPRFYGIRFGVQF